MFLLPEFYLSKEAEQAHYQLHENDPNDQGYRRFLGKLMTPLSECLTQEKRTPVRALDFGCGPGSAIVAMLQEQGHNAQGYDPLFADDKHLLFDNAGQAITYDLITCTEVIEHLHQPMQVLTSLLRHLKPYGWLAFMTGETSADPEAFANWFYRRDPTHVCFYQEATWRFIAHELGFTHKILSPGCLLLKAPYTEPLIR